MPLVAKGSPESDGTGCPNGDGRCDADYLLGINTAGNVIAADFEQIGKCTGGTNAGANCTAASICTGGGTCTNQGLNHPLSGTTAIVENRWYHAAVTYDGTTLRLYLNGMLESSVATGGVSPRFDSLQPAALGAMVRTTGAANGFYDGLLDEARIWNVARTAPEIQGTHVRAADRRHRAGGALGHGRGRRWRRSPTR